MQKMRWLAPLVMPLFRRATRMNYPQAFNIHQATCVFVTAFYLLLSSQAQSTAAEAFCDDAKALDGIKHEAQIELERYIKYENGEIAKLKNLSLEVTDAHPDALRACKATLTISISDIAFPPRFIYFRLYGSEPSWYNPAADIRALLQPIASELKRQKMEAAASADASATASEIQQMEGGGACPPWMSTPSFDATAASAFKSVAWKFSSVTNLWDRARVPVAELIENDNTQKIELPAGFRLAPNDFTTIPRILAKRAKVIESMSRASVAHCLPRIEAMLTEREQAQAAQDETDAKLNSADKLEDEGEALAVEKTTTLQPGGFVRQGGGFVQLQEYAPLLRITARVSRIEITSMSGNRDNCLLQPQAPLPTSLMFGQVLLVHPGCNTLELEVATNRGLLKYTWER